MKQQFVTGSRFLLIMILLTGFIYPGITTLVADLLFPVKANGSLVEKNGVIIGSELIGQNFNDERYFSSRPSVINYNPLPSGGSNLGLLNPELRKVISVRLNSFLKSNMLNKDQEIPSGMITASASGLDPHIPPSAAMLQVDRIVTMRGLNAAGKQKIINMINDLTEKPQFSVLGEPRINVFRLNLMLDSLK